MASSFARPRALALALVLAPACKPAGAGGDGSSGGTAGTGNGPGGTDGSSSGGTSDGGPGGSGSGGDGGSGSGGDTGAPACNGDGFVADPIGWSLPSSTVMLEGEPFPALGGAEVCSTTGNADFQHALADLDGDHHLDLVVTDACDAGNVGESKWLVYRGGDAGFSSDAMEWSLPSVAVPLGYDHFPGLGGTGVCNATGNADFQYALAELTGDGIVDLVITDACDVGGVGASKWLVYAGSTNGFSDKATAWSLPTAPAALGYDAFPGLAGTGICTATGYADFQYALADLDGDGKSDLVVTNACDTGDVGQTRWLFFPADAGGFASDAVAWTLPDSPAEVQGDPFPGLGGTGVCTATGYADFQYALMDLGGDGQPDLVMTNACDDGDVGDARWLVYPAGASGFANKAETWTLPTPTASLDYDPFAATGGSDTCSATGYTDFQYATVDLGGDGVPDLVVSDTCETGKVGATNWLVYDGGSGGFADDPRSWALPDALAPTEYDPFPALGGVGVCTATGYADFSWSTVDLGGDGAPDLVVTNACDKGGAGQAIWAVYPAHCG